MIQNYRLMHVLGKTFECLRSVSTCVFSLPETSPPTQCSAKGDIIYCRRLHLPCASFTAIPADPRMSLTADGLSVNDRSN